MKKLTLAVSFCVIAMFTQAQNVGIGIASPNFPLDVRSSTAITVQVLNLATGTNRVGIYAQATEQTNQGYGVHGKGNKFGLWGETESMTTGTGGVRGSAGTSGVTITGFYGVLGESEDGRGVAGTSRTNTGVIGYSIQNIGVRGEGAIGGVYGQSFAATSNAVEGLASNTSGGGNGVFGKSSSTNGGAGVRGESPYVGVWGDATSTTGLNWGIYGRTFSASGYGGYFTASGGGFAARFVGNVQVTGTLSKGAGSFQIDHPLDPENKYLFHSFVESPDMMNVYNGNATLDAHGEALITLPDWFEALNKDYRYQLTCVGGYAPIFIAKKIAGNAFQIGGGTAGLEVSWQVTGIRKDAFAEQNRIEVETLKPAHQRGQLLHPQAFGKPESMGMDVLPDQMVLQRN